MYSFKLYMGVGDDPSLGQMLTVKLQQGDGLVMIEIADFPELQTSGFISVFHLYSLSEKSPHAGFE